MSHNICVGGGNFAKKDIKQNFLNLSLNVYIHHMIWFHKVINFILLVKNYFVIFEPFKFLILFIEFSVPNLMTI